MSKTLEDKISLYLLNRLSPEEKKIFEAEMENDTAFKKEVRLQKEVTAALQYKRSVEAKAVIKNRVKNWQQHVSELNKPNLVEAAKQGLENLSDVFQTLVVQFFNPYNAAFKNRKVEQLFTEDQAYFYYNRKDYTKAIPLLQKLPDDYYEVQLMLGNALLAKREYKTAYPYFKKLIDEEAVFFLSDAHWYGGLCLTGLNQIERAKKHFQYLIDEENISQQTRQNAQTLINSLSQPL